MYAERGGDFAAMMDVMLEHTPDDPLARTCGPHFSSRLALPFQPHLGEGLERRLDHLCVTLTSRLIHRWEDLLEVSRGEMSKCMLDHLPGLLQPCNQLCRCVAWIYVRLADA